GSFACDAARGLRKTACGHLCGHAHRGLHVRGVRAALARDGKGGAVVDRRANNRDAERDVYRAMEVDQLHRDVALVVIHRDDEVELAAYAADKDGVRRVGAGAVEALCARFVDGGRDDLGVLSSEEVVLSGVRVQAGDRDARCAAEHEGEGIRAKLDGAHDARAVELTGFLEGDVRGDVYGGQLFARQQHAGFR